MSDAVAGVAARFAPGFPPGPLDVSDVHSALAAGPTLVAGGRPCGEREPDASTSASVSRGALGRTADGRLLLVVAEAGDAGWTLTEFGRLLARLGCTEARALEGDAPASCWIRGQGNGGVVGPAAARTEDRVAGAIAVFGRRVYVVDNDPGPPNSLDRWPGEFAPERGSVFTQAEGASGTFGRNFAFGLGNARGVWTIRVEEAGTYEVFARWPKGMFTANAEYRLAGASQEQIVRRGQRAGYGRWVPIGQVSADPSNPIRVDVRSLTHERVAADAVRAVRAGP